MSSSIKHVHEEYLPGTFLIMTILTYMRLLISGCGFEPHIGWHALGLPRWHSGKETACQCRIPRWTGFDPGVGKIPWSRNGNTLQYSCLENSMDRAVWWPTVHGSQTVGHYWARTCTITYYYALSKMLGTLWIFNIYSQFYYCYYYVTIENTFL